MRSVFLLLVAVWSAAPFRASAAEPNHWKAQIVDAETKRPLEGVVVLAVWNKRYASPGGLAGGGYFASEEVVTGPDGTFVIHAPKSRLLNPVAVLVGPDFYIFKPGYGRWRFAGQEDWQRLDYEQYEKRLDETWARFTGEGTVLELPQLRTRAERMEFILAVPGPMPDAPAERMRRHLEAIDTERASLGLGRLRLDSKERPR